MALGNMTTRNKNHGNKKVKIKMDTTLDLV